MKLSIYDLAEKANVSIATVSRVLNNSPKIKDETRTRILRLIEKFKQIESRAPPLKIILIVGVGDIEKIQLRRIGVCVPE